jgi:type II secretory ATPase GspE/PulE/Tfp pilus assembly ATPase PilB-like protein
MLSEGGAVVFAGTVGSGKSTTLASLIAGIPSHRKVITIEDPVEYLIPHAIQNTVARNLDIAAHQNYAAKLRALKRSAMSDVLLGEIRDQETGRAFMDLAGSGVNIYTTVHAASALLVPERLASDFIGVSRDFMAMPGVLKLLVFQALIPVLCGHCALPAHDLCDGSRHPSFGFRTEKQWRTWLALIHEMFGYPIETFKVRNPAGCAACAKPQLADLNGYCGRTVVAEIIEPQLWPEFLRGIRHGDVQTRLDHQTPWDPAYPDEVAFGRSALECAVFKASQGLIDPCDIESRFHAFETERRLRGLHSIRRPAVQRLRAVT